MAALTARTAALLLGAALASAPTAGAAQSYPWQRLDAVGAETGFVRSLAVRVSVEDGTITAAIDEGHADGTRIALTLRARLADLNPDAAGARESARSIHPHVGVVTLRCRGNARCVEYSTDTDSFFELPGPVVFGFYVRDAATAAEAVGDLRRMIEGGR